MLKLTLASFHIPHYILHATACSRARPSRINHINTTRFTQPYLLKSPRLLFAFWNSFWMNNNRVLVEVRGIVRIGVVFMGMGVLVWHAKFNWVDRSQIPRGSFSALVGLIQTKPQLLDLFATTAWSIWCRRNKARLNEPVMP
ncbi:hypothetical protein CFP56_007774, partial [Quercus suber]